MKTRSSTTSSSTSRATAFHTNEPWLILEYGASLGEIYDIVVEDMDRQSRGLKG